MKILLYIFIIAIFFKNNHVIKLYYVILAFLERFLIILFYYKRIRIFAQELFNLLYNKLWEFAPILLSYLRKKNIY